MPAREKDDGTARFRNSQVVKHRLKQREKSKVFGPAMRLYHERLPDPLPSTPPELARALLNNLTGPLVGALEETVQSMVARFEGKWAHLKDAPNFRDKVFSSVMNSKKRSAGTNFQSLVSYALANYLAKVDSTWYLTPNPTEFTNQLSIRFGPPSPPLLTDPPPVDAVDQIAAEILGEGEPKKKKKKESKEDADRPVTPDVDLLLRNAAWPAGDPRPEPVLLLSIKTSIVDRGGSAARWKMYFDIVSRPCPLICNEQCAYRGLELRMDNVGRFDIRHGIVTANIYSHGNADLGREKGELENNQTFGVTHVFSLKMTTRDDGVAVTPPDWKQFELLTTVLDGICDEFRLPRTAERGVPS